MAANASNDNKLYWVVVADESSAIIYGRESRSGPMRQLLSLSNEVARQKTDQLISDSGGRSFDSYGKGRHTMASDKADPKSVAAKAFAKEIAEQIANVVHQGKCRGYALVAAPRFLGILRKAISIATSTEPYATVDKDVVNRDTAFIEDLLKGL